MSRLSLAIIFLAALCLPAHAHWLNSNIAGAVNPDYRPAITDDFYVHVNHDWLSSAVIKPGYSRNSAFNELQEVIDARLLAIMNDKSLTGHDAQLVHTLYALWLDWPSRNHEGVSMLKPLMHNIDSITTLDELSEYFKTRESFYHGLNVAELGIGLDNKDSERYSLELGSSSLSLGDSAEYIKLTPNGERVKRMHDGIVSYMLRRLGYSEQEAEELLTAAYRFEGAIAGHIMTLEQVYSPDAVDKMYNPVTLDDLRQKSPNYPFADILEALGAVSELMNLQEPEWLARLNELYTPENLNDIKAYLMCRLAGGYIAVSDEAAYREYQRLVNERLGISGHKRDEELAVDFVHGELGSALSRLYVGEYVPAGLKGEVEELIGGTVSAYREMLKGAEWLSEAVRELAMKKLEGMRHNVLYPEEWPDGGSEGLELNVAGGLTQELEKVRAWKMERYFYGRLNGRVKHDEWISDVVVVNAYYRPSENSINIIAGIMGGEFMGEDRASMMGGLGCVIGHEISHAFDTVGAQFDETGNRVSWWTEDDYKEFQARADRLINYFNGLTATPEGEKYNGRLVQTESIADMAGVKAMLMLASRYEDFDYDKFFRKYAQIWKLINTRERADMTLKTDVHAPAYLRVNAVLSQYEEFVKCYGVKKGDGMYVEPEERIAVW